MAVLMIDADHEQQAHHVPYVLQHHVAWATIKSSALADGADHEQHTHTHYVSNALQRHVVWTNIESSSAIADGVDHERHAHCASNILHCCSGMEQSRNADAGVNAQAWESMVYAQST
eukprot:scaffold275810_cov24-Tisochrysis_lutea.AAC.1